MNPRTATAANDLIALRPLQRRDGADLYDLIAHCPPLDLNSRYAYLLLCEHHGATCVAAEAGGRLVGAVTAYMLPTRPDTLFVWQVAVAPNMQGQRLGSRMLEHLAERCKTSHDFRLIETTISPSNIGSQKLFSGFAKRRGIGMTAQPYFLDSDFGDGRHEEEWLYQLG